VARKLASFCSLIVLIAVLSGCGEAGSGSTPGAANGSPAASARKPFAVGQAMTNDAHQSVTVTAFKRGVSTGNEFLTPAAGRECVQTDLALVNGDSTSWSLPLFEMAVVDANGQSYSASFTCGGDSSTIQALIPKGKANTSIRFEVPTGGALLFTWTPSALNPNSTYQTDLK
jgi:hypothetical protein